MAVRYVEIGQYPDVRREVRGNLSEILAATANPGTYAAPEDVTGTFLEMGTDGKWDGASVGSFGSIAQLYALPTAYLAIGARASVNGVQYTYGAGGWVVVGAGTAALDNRTPLRVMGLGDSITYFGGGVGFTACAMSNGALTYFNMGNGGDTSAMVLARITQIAAYKPDIVLLQIGTNDWPVGSIPATGAISTETNINAIVDYIVSIGATPVLITVPPQNSYKTQTIAVNRVIERVAYNRHILLSSRWREMGNSGDWSYGSGYSDDTIHPNMEFIPLEGNDLFYDLKNAGLIPSSAPLSVRVSQGDGIFSNACFSSTSAGIASGVTVFGGGTPSIVANGTKGNWQKLIINSQNDGLRITLGNMTANSLYHSTMRVRLTAPAGSPANFSLRNGITGRNYDGSGGISAFKLQAGQSKDLVISDLFSANWGGNITFDVVNNVIGAPGAIIEITDVQAWKATTIGMVPSGVLTNDGGSLAGLLGFYN